MSSLCLDYVLVLSVTSICLQNQTFDFIKSSVCPAGQTFVLILSSDTEQIARKMEDKVWTETGSERAMGHGPMTHL